MRHRHPVVLLLVVLLAGCGREGFLRGGADEPPAPRPVPTTPASPAADACGSLRAPGPELAAREGQADLGAVIVPDPATWEALGRGRRTVPVLVAPGIAVRLRVEGAASFEGAFAACPPVPAAQRARRLLGHRVVQVRLDVRRAGCARMTAGVDGGAVVSRWFGVGRAGCAGAERATGGIVAACHRRVEPAADPALGLPLGPLVLLVPAEGSTTGAPSPVTVKLPVAMLAGAVATVRVAPPAELRAGGEARRARTVTYVGCPADEPRFSARRRPVGPFTGFAGDLRAPARGCVRLAAWTPGGVPLRTGIPLGGARC